MNRTEEQKKAAALADLLIGISNGWDLQAKNSYGWEKVSCVALFNQAESENFCWFTPEYWRVVQPAPKSKWCPWNMQDIPIGKCVKRKCDGSLALIIFVKDDMVTVGLNDYTNQGLLECWECMDGTPCGTELKP